MGEPEAAGAAGRQTAFGQTASVHDPDGYRLGDKVVRPARLVDGLRRDDEPRGVARNGAEDASS